MPATNLFRTYVLPAFHLWRSWNKSLFVLSPFHMLVSCFRFRAWGLWMTLGPTQFTLGVLLIVGPCNPCNQPSSSVELNLVVPCCTQPWRIFFTTINDHHLRFVTAPGPQEPRKWRLPQGKPHWLKRTRSGLIDDPNLPWRAPAVLRCLYVAQAPRTPRWLQFGLYV